MFRSAAVLSFAFRPFFLLSAITAIFVVALWVLFLNGHAVLASGENLLLWHGHEMLVGFVMATIAGFVLTAVATWTGRAPVKGLPLLVLALLWVAGRTAMTVPGLPAGLVLLVDAAFPLALAATVAREIFAAGNRRNYPIVAITALLATANIVYHLSALGYLQIEQRTILFLLMHLVLLLVTVIGGRILPNFTANWMRGQGIERPPVNHPLLDRLVILTTLVLGVQASFGPDSTATGALALLAAVLQGRRLSQWRGLATVRNPLLFVLHVSYAWLPVGYALLALAILGGTGSTSGALHALAMGGIGSMILSMMTRVPLGHTGRALLASRWTVVAYCTMFLAILLRIAASLPSLPYLALLNLAAMAWCISFAIFLFVYLPILVRPKVVKAAGD